MTVFADQAKYHAVHEGTDFWFCAPGCLHAFENDPAVFAHRDAGS
jgi:YHS domain-containing protein